MAGHLLLAKHNCQRFALISEANGDGGVVFKGDEQNVETDIVHEIARKRIALGGLRLANAIAASIH
jgi:hypothetical protein